MQETTAAEPSLARNIAVLKGQCRPFLAALEDPMTTEILLNEDGKIWQEKINAPMQHIGTLEPYLARSLLNIVATCLGKELRQESPLLEGEFPIDGSRFAGQIPPVVRNPVFAIRKPATALFTLDQYVKDGILTPIHREVLRNAVTNRKNIIVTGGTSSGKTTFLNALIYEIVERCPAHRLLIAEDTDELQCKALNFIKYHTTSMVGFTDILKTFLRMRPDRIIFGEVRDHAALDLLDAWNTGHAGGCATLHANDAAAGLTRLRSLVSRHPFAPRVIEEIIGDAVDFVVHIAKTPEGRRVKEIIEILGYSIQAKAYSTKTH